MGRRVPHRKVDWVFLSPFILFAGFFFGGKLMILLGVNGTCGDCVSFAEGLVLASEPAGDDSGFDRTIDRIVDEDLTF
jgi:hypothetical protein